MTWWVSSWKHKIRLSKCSSHRESVRQAQNLIARWKMNNAHCKRKQEWLAICGSLQCCFVVKRTKIKVVNKDTILLWRDTDPPLQGGRKWCRRLQCGERWDEMRETSNCGELWNLFTSTATQQLRLRLSSRVPRTRLTSTPPSSKTKPVICHSHHDQTHNWEKIQYATALASNFQNLNDRLLN